MSISAALWWACIAAEVAMGAVALWRRLRPVAYLMGAALVIDVVTRVIQWKILHGSAKGLEGWPRAAYHLETALLWTWPAALAATCWRVFAPAWDARRAVPAIAAAWTVAVSLMAASYPLPVGWTARAFVGWELWAVAGGVWAVWRGWGAAWGRAHHVLLVLLATEGVIALVGPYTRGQPWVDWDIARAVYVVAFAVVAGLMGRRPAPAREP